MFDLVLIAAVCIVPPLLFLIFVAAYSKSRRRQAVLLVSMFVSGMFAAAFGFFIFTAIDVLPAYRSLLIGNPEMDTLMVAYVMGVVGPIEETLKLAAVVIMAQSFRMQLKPRDALVFVAASSLGFATSENWYAMYAIGGPDMGRAVVVPFAHLLFSSFTGSGYARSIAYGTGPWPVYGGLALASVYHGLYDILESRGGLWHFATMPMIVLLWYFLTRNLRGSEVDQRSFRKS